MENIVFALLQNPRVRGSFFRQLHNWVKTQKKGGIDEKGTVKAFQGVVVLVTSLSS